MDETFSGRSEKAKRMQEMCDYYDLVYSDMLAMLFPPEALETTGLPFAQLAEEDGVLPVYIIERSIQETNLMLENFSLQVLEEPNGRGKIRQDAVFFAFGQILSLLSAEVQTTEALCGYLKKSNEKSPYLIIATKDYEGNIRTLAINTNSMEPNHFPWEIVSHFAFYEEINTYAVQAFNNIRRRDESAKNKKIRIGISSVKNEVNIEISDEQTTWLQSVSRQGHKERKVNRVSLEYQFINPKAIQNTILKL